MVVEAPLDLTLRQEKNENVRVAINFAVLFSVPLGSIPELPAKSCKEIKASEGAQAVSGKYWFDSIKPGKTLLVDCDMNTEGE